MCRFTRRLFTLCSAASLLLCVAVCVLWVRSKWVRDQAWRGEPESDAVAVVGCANGTLYVATVCPWTSVGPWRLESEPIGGERGVGMGWPFPHARGFALPGVRAFRGRGQLYLHGPRATDVRQTGLAPATMVYVSMWLPAAVTAASPALVVTRRVRGSVRRRRRRSRGLCLACGYDVRANPDRCPECGTVPEVTA